MYNHKDQFEISLLAAQYENLTMQIKVWDDDSVGKDLIGEIDINLKQYVVKGEPLYKKWYDKTKPLSYQNK